MTNRHQNNATDGDIDFGYLFGILLDNKWLIIITAFVALMLGWGYGKWATPIYRGDVLLQLEKKSGGVPGLTELNSMYSDKASASAEIEILRSRMVLGEVAQQLKMDIAVFPDREGYFSRFTAPEPSSLPAPPFAAFRDSETYIEVSEFAVPDSLRGARFTLKQEQGNPALYRGQQLIASGPANQPLVNEDENIRLVLSQWAYGNEPIYIVKRSVLSTVSQLRSSLKVQDMKEASMLRLQVIGPDKKRIEEILDVLSNTYLLQNIQRRSAQAENSLAFLDQQLPKVKEKLTEAEDALNNYRLETETIDMNMETQTVLQKVIEIENKLNELKVQEIDVATRYTKEHPVYKNLIQQRASLSREKRELSKQIKQLPETQQTILRLTRDVRVTQQIYVGLLNKVQELRILKAGTVGSVRIIDNAVVYPGPIKPKRALLMLISCFLGGLGAALWVLLNALLKKGIESPELLEEQGVAVYATIPLSEKQVKANRATDLKQRRSRKLKESATPIPLLAQDDPTDLAIEALRSLRTSLHFAMMDAENKLLMITGPSPEVGKSFVSANLGAVLAQTGQRVLVIDADMRKGHLHRYFQSDNKIGLSAYLSGQSTKEDIIQSSGTDNLDFIARGKAPPNPSELLMHERFKALMNSLSEDYDLILVDTPPILAVTDAAIVGQVAGSSLLVTRFGMNSVKEVDAALTRFAQNKVEIKGAILNCMERRATNEYGYYAYEYGKSSD
jgi:tyrosine-protein kinase Etk/Wzc